MSNDEIQRFADCANDIALKNAANYLHKHGLKASPEALSACLNSWIKIKLPEAMKDAKDAFDCGMNR